MTLMPENEILERHRLVADAIILERAGRVLRRRDPVGVLVDETEHAVVLFLRNRARSLRAEAEREHDDS